MGYQPHYIASFEEDSGLFTYTEPFLAPEKAFPVLEDAYCFRGTVRKRGGFKLLGRLRRRVVTAGIGNIDSGTLTYNVFTGMGLLATEPNAQLQPGTVASPIVIVVGPQTLTDTLGTGSLAVAGVGSIQTASIAYATGVLTLTFNAALVPTPANITTWYYPCLPVMGLRTQELNSINDEGSIAFDQKYAYWFNNGTKRYEELPSALAVTWHGSNSDFFYSTNYWTNPTAPPSITNKLFWVTNTNMTAATRDPVRYYNGKPTDAGVTWSAPFQPIIYDAGLVTEHRLYNAEIILPYKGRLLFLNTWEGVSSIPPAVGDINNAINFPNRIRFSQVGDPLQVDAFQEDIVGKGGSEDAPTSEAIVGAEFIKDTLIVKFERSSWKFVYTGDQSRPFIFQKINTELGSESKFSLVPFDRGVFSVGNYGITTDDSVNVERIDIKIPNTIFQFNNDQRGTYRVHGIRDYTDELVYWTYPTSRAASVGGVSNEGFPNKMLVLNYRNETYSIFNDSFTCFGNFQIQNDETWADLTYLTWSQWLTKWESGSTQSLFPSIIAGNQQGFVELLNKNTINDVSLAINAIIVGAPAADPRFTVPQHNLNDGDIVKITGIIGSGVKTPSALNGKTFRVDVIDPNTIELDVFWTLDPDPLNNNKFYGLKDPIVNLIDATSVYIGNGLITRFNNIKIATKRFSPFYESGFQCRIGFIDYFLEKTTNGEITSSIYIDENSSISLTDNVSNTCLFGNSSILTRPENLTLIPFQSSQDKIWHRQYIQAVAQNFQVVLTMSEEQLAQEAIAKSSFSLYALAFYISQNARMVQ